MKHYSTVFTVFILWLTMGKSCNTENRFSQPVSQTVSYSTPENKKIYPFAGLANVGNTCYMNAVLQVVAALYSHGSHVLSVKQLIHKINGQCVPLLREDVQNFRKTLASEVKVTDLKNMLNLDQQEDPGEFLTLLNESFSFLEGFKTRERVWLRERSDDKPILMYKDRNSQDELLLNVSMGISNLSQQISAQLEELRTEEPIEKGDDFIVFNDLSQCAPFVPKNSEHLEIGPNKDGKYQYISQCIIEALPDQLCIVLKRYDKDLKKIATAMQGTASIAFIPDPDVPSNSVNYTLGGFISHIGDSATCGHYIACVKRNKQWYKVDDAIIEEISEEEAIKNSSLAYLLFYTKT